MTYGLIYILHKSSLNIHTIQVVTAIKLPQDHRWNRICYLFYKWNSFVIALSLCHPQSVQLQKSDSICPEAEFLTYIIVLIRTLSFVFNKTKFLHLKLSYLGLGVLCLPFLHSLWDECTLQTYGLYNYKRLIFIFSKEIDNSFQKMLIVQ